MATENRGPGLTELFAEMRRRRLVRFMIGYAAAAFVALQLAEIVFPAFGIGEGGLRLLVVMVTLGFLPAVVLAWIYDLTREGIRRTEDHPGSPLPLHVTLIAFAMLTLGVTGSVGWYLVDQGVLSSIGSTGVAYDATDPIRSLAVLPLDDFSQ